MADDAFIYSRMAQQIASGHGWSFNTGYPTNAATSPFYVLAVAAAVFLHLSAAHALLVVSFVGLFSLGAALYFAASGYSSAASLLIAVLVCNWPPLLRDVGLETPVFLGTIALTALFYQRDRPVLSGIFVGIVCLGRPEGLVLVVILVAADLVRLRRFRLPLVGSAACVVAPWLLFCLFQFHTVVPHTMTIKHIQSSITGWTDGSWHGAFTGQLLAPYLLGVFALVGVISSIQRFNDQPQSLILISFGVIQVCGYSVMRAPLSYFWYFAPGNLAYSLAVGLGLVAVMRYVTARLPEPRLSLRISVAVALLCTLVYQMRRIRAESQPYRLSGDYIAISQWLRSHATQNDWVACDEIGYIGAYSQRNIRDMLGLIEGPSAIAPLKAHRWDWWLTDDPEPKFIVVHQVRWPGEPGAGQMPWSASSLALFARDYAPVYHSGQVEIYQRH